MSRVGIGKRLGGDTAGTVDPNWPKEYFIPYDTTFSKKNWSRGRNYMFSALLITLLCLLQCLLSMIDLSPSISLEFALNLARLINCSPKIAEV